MFPLLKYSEADVETHLVSVSADAVRNSLAKARPDWFDLLNLISKAAHPFLPEMRRVAQTARRR